MSRARATSGSRGLARIALGFALAWVVTLALGAGLDLGRVDDDAPVDASRSSAGTWGASAMVVKSPCGARRMNEACSTSCACGSPLLCSTSTPGAVGKCVMCTPDKMYNCLSTQKCLDDQGNEGPGKCFYVACGNPPQAPGDACTAGGVCDCPSSGLLGTCVAGKCKRACSAGSPCPDPFVCSNGFCAKSGGISIPKCANKPTRLGDACSNTIPICPCPTGLSCIAGKCAACGGRVMCRNGGVCVGGRCLRFRPVGRR